MIILDGRKINTERAEEMKEKISSLSIKPHLVIVQIGHRPESNIYVGQKVAFGKKIGADVTVHNLEEGVSTEEVVSDIKKFNEDQAVHGIILQLPVPEDVDVEEVLNSISPEKDVDGLSANNIRRLATNSPKGNIPATAKGVTTLLREYDIDVAGKNIAVVGRSLLVGKTLSLLLTNLDATVTLCHSKTANLSSVTKNSDIVIVATGQPNLITKDHVKEGQVIVDVGITSIGDRQITGDVSFEEVKDVVYAISPVPGGVGPMTVLSLFENVLKNV